MTSPRHDPALYSNHLEGFNTDQGHYSYPPEINQPLGNIPQSTLEAEALHNEQQSVPSHSYQGYPQSTGAVLPSGAHPNRLVMNNGLSMMQGTNLGCPMPAYVQAYP